MSTRVVDQVDEWKEQPFPGGYRALHDLADDEFSGVIRAGGAELFMIKGAVVGIRGGDIEEFEDSTGTIYEAPTAALPLLAIMQEESDEVRAKYYTEKTTIAEVDNTLTDGGFTGYIELSENVLSGDYYLVYHAGRSMSVAYVGESGRLIDGDEAFETADDEVGIYKVRPVGIDQIEIPEPADPVEQEPATGTGGGDAPEPEENKEAEMDFAESPPAESSGTEDAEVGITEPDQPVTGKQSPDPETAESTTSSRAGPDETEPAGTEHGQTAQRDQDTPSQTRQSEDTSAGTTASSSRQSGSAGPADETEEPQSSDESGRAGSARTTTDSTAGAERTPATDQSGGGTQRADQQRRSGEEPGFQPAATGQPEQVRQGQQDTHTGGHSLEESSLELETRAVPSLDPAQTAVPEQERQGARGDTLERTREQKTVKKEPTRDQQPVREEGRSTQESRSTQERGHDQTARPSESTEPAADHGETVEAGRLAELEAELEQREEEIDRLESELERKTTEYEDAEEQLTAVRAERDDLAAEVDRLEEELERLESEFGAATDTERRMTGPEALAGTDIFVRYHSKGDATLEKAHDGSHRREDVNDNLRLEKHTQFEAASVSVGGQAYAEFLERTLEYQFVEWVIRELLFEIRDTGHSKALADLYNVLPAVDRAELAGVVDVVYTEDGQETRSQESFDIVLRNRMGNPLLVANLNDSREAATESMMENLITAAERVGQSSDEFSGAFLVTRSFFEPGALETANASTQGGLLSRDKRKSFVNLSRKQGYHLCLVEARNENFHLAVPEL